MAVPAKRGVAGTARNLDFSSLRWHIATYNWEQPMAQSVKLSDGEMRIIRREAELQSRSIAGQITHWVRIGRTIERSPNFDYRRVRAALAAELSPDALTLEEQTVWLDQVDGYLAEPGADPAVAAAFDDLARRPGAAGRDADGKLVVIDKDTAETS